MVVSNEGAFLSDDVESELVFCVSDTFIFRFLSAAFLHFCNCISSSGRPLRNAGCAYMSVSGPFRILVKPYCRRERER